MTNEELIAEARNPEYSGGWGLLIDRLADALEISERDAATVAHLRKVADDVRAHGGVNAHLSDAEVAGRVRMLMRNDVDHEMVCVMGRDRIIALSSELAKAKAEFCDHTKAVGDFLNEGARPVRETISRLRDAAIAQRDQVADLASAQERIARLESAFGLSLDAETGRWLAEGMWRTRFNNPFIRIDMHDLVDRGFAIWDGDAAIQFTDKGLDRMKKWTPIGAAYIKIAKLYAEMRLMASGETHLVRCGGVGCLTDDCGYWGKDCKLLDDGRKGTLCFIGRTVAAPEPVEPAL